MISIEQALELIDQTVKPLSTTEIPLLESVGCALASDIQSDVDSPPHDKSVMDGFAVRSVDINACTKRLKIVETIIAGGWPTKELESGQAIRIMTGAPIPIGADAVVMVELCKVERENGEEFVTLDIEDLQPEKHLLRRGTNFSKGQTVFAKGHTVRPTDIGLLAEVGAASLNVFERPTVSVLPTGNELVDCSELPGRGEIRNSNGPMLIAMANEYASSVNGLGLGKDDPDELRKLIAKGLEADLLLLSGGVSAGTMDLVPGILKELDVEQVFHKVKVKPGKPIWFGYVCRDNDTQASDGKPKRTYVFGLPGNPVSSLVGFRLFVCAAIRKMTGSSVNSNRSATATLSEPHECRGDRPTYWPVQLLNNDSSERSIKPLVWRGSSDLLALGKADGLAYFPANSGLSEADTKVRFHPFS